MEKATAANTYPGPKLGGRQHREGSGRYLTVTFTLPRLLVVKFRQAVRRGDRSAFMALALEAKLQDTTKSDD